MDIKKVCVAGCGALGTIHAKTWAKREDAKVVAVADLNIDSARKLAKELECEAYSNFKDAVMHDGVNVVSVCTPTAFHPEISCFAMENGKDVLCEKPIALSIEEAKRMMECSEKTGKKLGISFQKRDAAFSKKCRELYQNGVFGKAIHLVCSGCAEVRPKKAMHSVKLNGGPVIDLLCHHTDILAFITGETPQSVFAAGDIFAADKNWIPDPENLAVDAATVTVKYSGGSVLSYYINWGLPSGLKAGPEGRCEIFYGSNAYAVNSDGNLKIVHADREETFNLAPVEFAPPGRIDELVEAINNNKPMSAGAPEGLMALKVSLAALESIKTGEAVKIN
jgi:predicted dehydrogenase